MSTEKQDKKEIEALRERNAKLEANNALLISQCSSQLSSKEPANEIDLLELWQIVWKGKILIVIITMLFAVGSVVYALSIPPEYQSTAILSPASSSNSNSLSKLAGQFGGLASLAGINLGGGGGDDKATIGIEVIKTWGFLERFIENNNIQVELFASNGWNKKSNKLKVDSDIYNSASKEWVRPFDPNKFESAAPTSWELYQKLIERMVISRDKNTGLITLTVSFYSPYLAKEWVDKLIIEINNHLKEQDKIEAQKSIEYLKAQINKTNVSEMKSVFYQLIEQQSKTLMLTEVSEEYVFKTISPAKVAEERFKPKRAVIAILGTMLGGVLAVVIVILMTLFRKENEVTQPAKKND